MDAATEGNAGDQAAARPGFAERLGLPSPKGRWRFIAAVLTDTFGVGLLFPISLLYFTLVTHYSVARLGLLLTVATVASLPFGLLGGGLADRFGPRRLMVANNLCSAVGYVGYYLAGRIYVIFCGMFLVAVADRMFWSSWSPYLRRVAADDQFNRWYAFIEALKAGCLGLGAGLAGLLLGAGGNGALRVLVLVNIATCLVSATLIGLQRLPAPRTAPGDPGQQPGWGSVLRDARILTMGAGQMLLTPVTLLATIALPVFYVRGWHLGSWVGPTLFMIGSAIFFLAQSYTAKIAANVKTVTIFIISGGLYCAAMVILVVFTSYYHPASHLALVLALAITILITFGIMLNAPTSNTALMSMVTDQTAGRAAGVFHTGTSVAMAFSPSLMGGLLAAPSELWITVAAGSAVGTACFAGAMRRSARITAAAAPDTASVPAAGG